MNSITAVILVLAALLPSGLSLECYKCSSKTNNACHDPFTKHVTLDTIECKTVRDVRGRDGTSALGAAVCYKAIVATDGEDMPHIERGCGTMDYCQTRQATGRLKGCTTCDDELCNSSPRHLQSSIALIVVPLVIVLKYF